MLIDCDQHLYEPRNLWREQCDPSGRDDALAIEDDDLGYAWVTWRGTRLGIADVQAPGETVVIGERRRRQAAGEPALTAYDEVLPDDFWEPAARADRIRAMGFDAAMCFPNFGLLWERRVGVDLPALHTNMGAWNRWCATVVRDSAGTLYPSRTSPCADLDWLEAQLTALDAAGVKLAMIAPALVDGKQLSHPDLERAWRSFIEHDVTPVFHVADQPRVFDDAWYTDDGTAGVNVVESVFLYTPAALAITDLIVNGVLDRHARAAHRRGRALCDLGPAVPDDAGRWLRVHVEAQRQRAREAVDATQRVLPPAGPRRGVLVRAPRAARAPGR